MAALAGCDMPPAVQERASVLGGTMALAAPAGYCVDTASQRNSAQGSFVLFGSCAAIGNDGSLPHPQYRAALTATVGPKADAPLVASFPAFQDFFRSRVGRGAIARSGLAKDVDIIAVRQEKDMMLLKIRDRSGVNGAPVSEIYWRAIVSLENRITALSVLPLRSEPISDAGQIALLKAFYARIEAANTAAASAKP